MLWFLNAPWLWKRRSGRIRVLSPHAFQDFRRDDRPGFRECCVFEGGHEFFKQVVESFFFLTAEHMARSVAQSHGVHSTFDQLLKQDFPGRLLEFFQGHSRKPGHIAVRVIKRVHQRGYRSDIDASMRVQHRGFDYDIEAVLPDDRRVMMDLICKRVT